MTPANPAAPHQLGFNPMYCVTHFKPLLDCLIVDINMRDDKIRALEAELATAKANLQTWLTGTALKKFEGEVYTAKRELDHFREYSERLEKNLLEVVESQNKSVDRAENAEARVAAYHEILMEQLDFSGGGTRESREREIRYRLAKKEAPP